MSRIAVALCLVFASSRLLHAEETGPVSLDDRIKVELYAESPQIVTPTGIDVDAHGRVWALESNTHFPPEGYTGHPTDRLLVFQGVGQDGRAERVATFTEGFVHAMSVAVRPNGDIVVATRKEIFVLRDDNNDLKPDAPPKRIMLLDTPGDYPHNGLAGFAFDGLGYMFFGCGENLGADYKLIGSDGTSLAGGGEGGNVYRCRPDGTKLEHWATGFWNPHASCVDAFGNLFTVDNDPDSRPPCRLLHIVAGGDYGYRFRNGRRGTHPFTAWDGELPGTLPMVAGTGEAPSGVLAYESDGLPDEYRGNLLATSWGDHRVERFRLQPKGRSLTSRAEPLITGGENFRPVGIALAPDGSLFFTDWVLKEYKVHGQGRVWRISAAQPPSRGVVDASTISGRPMRELRSMMGSPRLDVRRAAANALTTTQDGKSFLDTVVRSTNAGIRNKYEATWALERAAGEGRIDLGTDALAQSPVFHRAHPAHWNPQCDFDDPVATQLSYADLQHSLLTRSLGDLNSQEFNFSDPFVSRAAIKVIARLWDEKTLRDRFDAGKLPHAATRMIVLLAARMKNPKFAAVVERGLSDPDPAVRRAAVQWVGEEKLVQYRPQLEAVLSDGAVTAELFEAVLASLELLDGVAHKPTEEVPGSQYVLALLRDETKAATVRARALRMLPPTAKELDAALLAKLIASDDRGLKLEAIRTLQQSPFSEASTLLQAIARDETLGVDLRTEAILGLAPWASTSDEPNAARSLLLELARSPQASIRTESLRSLRALADNRSDVRSLLEMQRDKLLQRDSSSQGRREWADQLAVALGKTLQAEQARLLSAGSQRPADASQWIEAVSTEGNREAGGRVFFHSKSTGCYRCHTVNGRGGRVGPDLSVVARTMDRRKLIQSILEPSREVAPQFVTWTLVTKAGKVHNGMIVSETRDGKLLVGDAEGKLTELSADEVEQRTPQKVSLMPEKLIDQLTVDEFRDLLAFLETLK